MNSRERMLAVCWVVLIGWNVVVISVPIVSDAYIPLKPDRYKIEAVTDQTAAALSGVENEDVRILIRSEDLALVPLVPFGAVNLLGLLLLLWLGQTDRRTR